MLIFSNVLPASKELIILNRDQHELAYINGKRYYNANWETSQTPNVGMQVNLRKDLETSQSFFSQSLFSFLCVRLFYS